MIAQNISKTISFSRFPLILLIVLIHGRIMAVDGGALPLTSSEFPVSYNLTYLISEVFAEVAIGIFFCISGYLFFCNMDSMELYMYKSKLKSRLHSLFVPYIFWNTVLLIVFYMIGALGMGGVRLLLTIMKSQIGSVHIGI